MDQHPQQQPPAQNPDGQPGGAPTDARKIVLPPGVTLPDGEGISADEAMQASGGAAGIASNAEVAELQAQLEQLQRDAEAEKLRSRAELENVRKRIQRTADDRVKYATEGLLRDLLGVTDDFDRALNAAAGTTDVNALIEGLRYVQAGFQKAIADHGVQPIPTDGEPFDPAVHEAVDLREDPEKDDNTIIATHRAGYTLHDRVLRAAQVIVVKNPTAAAE